MRLKTQGKTFRGYSSLPALTGTLMLSLLLGWTLWAQADKPAPKKAVAPVATGAANLGALSATDATAMQARFTKDVWPLLTRNQANCVTCHGASNPSQLHFHDANDAAASFQMLLADGRFDPNAPSSLLARITSTDAGQRMPPTGMPAWSDADKKILQAFDADLASKRQAVASDGPKADEIFPPALSAVYHGAMPATVGDDNTFLTYFQLKRKVSALFGDDWQRDGKDMFEENVGQFAGADFEHRFDESNRPAPAYLTAASLMASDIAARAYLTKNGPFAGRPDQMPLTGDAARAEITKLYQRLIFRAPTPLEMRDSLLLLQNVSGAKTRIADETDPLIFSLTATDESGQRATQQIEIGSALPTYGLHALFVDESSPATDTQALPGTYTLKPGDAGQHLEISNRGTSGEVSFKSVTLVGPLPDKTATVITSDNPAVQAEGAWKGYGDKAKDGYGDDDNNKGSSTLIVPLQVAKPGAYQVSVTWRKAEAPAAPPPGAAGKRRRRGPSSSAENVPVAIYSHDPSQIALPAAPPIPPQGQAEFAVDQSDDSRKFWDSGVSFLFAGAKNGLEVSNKDTHRKVVADSVAYVPASAPNAEPAQLILGTDVPGHDGWNAYKADLGHANEGTVLAKQQLSDDGKPKGSLSLLFAPGKPVAPTQYYHALFHYPGRVENETRVPITIYAAKSSPIIRLQAPFLAPLGANMTLDASASYNVQHTPLHYTWTQIGGPRVALTDAHAATLHFVAPRLTVQQAAWEGLCRALVLHPDFLFSRPRTLATTTDPATRRRLQLVKIAQDLVARPPTAAEVAQIDKGAPLTVLVNQYLASPEFEDYYYRRVRLYLESHGTPTQDEPARLWRYVMHNNLPYTEILTADYTITPNGTKEMRPAYCGHSGVLSMPGFIEGKPGLPHFNYAAQVCQKFLGYVFEVTPEIVRARGTQTAASTVDPKSICYSCHQVLTPLAYQRTRWTDDGQYKVKDTSGDQIDDTDRKAVASYPFKGEGLAAFAESAQKKERFHRTIIQTHFIWLFGREMRWDADERGLYRRLWAETHKDKFAIKPLIRTLVTSPEYLGESKPAKGSGFKAQLASR